MKRTFLVAGVAIAVLFGAGVAIILALSSPALPAATADPRSPPPPPTTLAPAPPGPPAAAPFKGGKLYPSASDPALRLDGERRGETSTAMAGRVTRKVVHKALRAASVQSRLAQCTTDGGFGGFGGTPATGRAPRAPATLLLELEARAGELRIVDAQVGAWGEVSAATVSCAQAVLRGQVVPAPTHRRPAGERIRMPFTLNLPDGTVGT